MLGNEAVTAKPIHMADRMVRAATGNPAGTSSDFAGTTCERSHRDDEDFACRGQNSLAEHQQNAHGLFILSGHYCYLLPATCSWGRT